MLDAAYDLWQDEANFATMKWSS